MTLRTFLLFLSLNLIAPTVFANDLCLNVYSPTELKQQVSLAIDQASGLFSRAVGFRVKPASSPTPNACIDLKVTNQASELTSTSVPLGRRIDLNIPKKLPSPLRLPRILPILIARNICVLHACGVVHVSGSIMSQDLKNTAMSIDELNTDLLNVMHSSVVFGTPLKNIEPSTFGKYDIAVLVSRNLLANPNRNPLGTFAESATKIEEQKSHWAEAKWFADFARARESMLGDSATIRNLSAISVQNGLRSRRAALAKSNRIR